MSILDLFGIDPTAGASIAPTDFSNAPIPSDLSYSGIYSGAGDSSNTVPSTFNAAQDSQLYNQQNNITTPYTNAPSSVNLGSLNAGGQDWGTFLSKLGNGLQSILNNPAQAISLGLGLGSIFGGWNKPTSAAYQGTIPNIRASRSVIPGAFAKAPTAATWGQPHMGRNYFTPVTYTGAAKGGYLNGSSDGMADQLSTSIDGVQPAKLSHGEFVVPADVVSHLGNGNSDAGANVLYKMMDKVRKARTGTTQQGKEINPDKMLPKVGYDDGGSVFGGSVGTSPNYDINQTGVIPSWWTDEQKQNWLNMKANELNTMSQPGTNAYKAMTTNPDGSPANTDFMNWFNTPGNQVAGQMWNGSAMVPTPQATPQTTQNSISGQGGLDTASFNAITNLLNSASNSGSNSGYTTPVTMGSVINNSVLPYSNPNNTSAGILSGLSSLGTLGGQSGSGLTGQDGLDSQTFNALSNIVNPSGATGSNYSDNANISAVFNPYQGASSMWTQPTRANSYGGGGVVAFVDGGTAPLPATTANTPAPSANVNVPNTTNPYGTQPSNTPGTTSTSMSSGLSPWVGGYVTNMLGQAQGLAQTPYQAYQGPLTAGTSPLQQQGYSAISGWETPQSLQQAATNIGNTASQFGPIGSVQDYMSPYIQSVVQQQEDEARRQSDITRNQTNAQLAQAGAYGGSRQQLADTEIGRNLGILQNQIASQGYNTAWNNAQNQRNAAAQIQGQLGSQLASTGTQQANAGLAGIQNLLNAGAGQQNTEQQGINADINQFNQQLNWPYQQLQFQQSMLQGLPVGTSTQTTNVSPWQNVSTGILNGLGTLGSLTGINGASSLGNLIQQIFGSSGGSSTPTNVPAPTKP